MEPKHEPQVESFRANDGGVLRDPMCTRLLITHPDGHLPFKASSKWQSQGEMKMVTDLPQD